MTTPSIRLKQARANAGYGSASLAVERFHWNYATYTSHENGSRGITPAAAKRYARAFKVDESWLLFGTPASPGTPAPGNGSAPALYAQAGFSESMAEPFVGRTKTQMATISEAGAALCPTCKRPEIYQTTHSALDFGLLAGDILIVDLATRDLIAGDLVLLNITDPDSGEPHTSIRRFLDGWVIPSMSETGAAPLRLDDDAVGLMGTSVAALRAPHLD